MLKSKFASLLENEMSNNLDNIASLKGHKEINTEDLPKVGNLLNNAMEILDDFHRYAESDHLLNILNKIAKKNKNESNFLSEFDSVYDDEGVDELLAYDIEEDKNKDKDIQTDFEDE